MDNRKIQSTYLQYIQRFAFEENTLVFECVVGT